MKLTRNVISRKEALKICSKYVKFVEGDHDRFNYVSKAFDKIKKGQSVLTYTDGQFVITKVTLVDKNDFRAIDGPVVRVSNGEYSWRVDGDKYAYPVAKNS